MGSLVCEREIGSAACELNYHLLCVCVVAKQNLFRQTPTIKIKSDLLTLLAPVVQRLDNATHRINHYPVDSVVCFVNT